VNRALKVASKKLSKVGGILVKIYKAGSGTYVYQKKRKGKL